VSSVANIIEAWFDANADSSDAGYSAVSHDKLQALAEALANSNDEEVQPSREEIAFNRARRALQLAVQPNFPLPSVRLFPDGSAEFIFPGKLAQALKGRAEALTAMIGSNQLSVASTVAEDADAVSIRVSGEVLGREKD